ncbi:MAG: hypothetical protein RQ833_12150 [Sphingomonadaceae bacterium]|nr:hypothetical protein [Sphingomonadaceae bacterium]
MPKTITEAQAVATFREAAYQPLAVLDVMADAMADAADAALPTDGTDRQTAWHIHVQPRRAAHTAVRASLAAVNDLRSPSRVGVKLVELEAEAQGKGR